MSVRAFLSLLLLPAEQDQGEREQDWKVRSACFWQQQSACSVCWYGRRQAAALHVWLGKGDEGSAVVWPDASVHGLRVG